jgi:hypothetical protein
LVFEKNANFFFAENWQKSQKIVIITSTPGRHVICGPGLPDDIFSNKKSHFGQTLEGLEMESMGIFYGHLVYFMAIWSISWPFGMFYCHFA